MEEKKTRKAPLSEGQHVRQDKTFKQLVMETPKEKITIFPEYEDQAEMLVTINGVDFHVPVGVETEQPQPVAQAIRDHIAQSMAIKALEKANRNRNAGIL